MAGSFDKSGIIEFFLIEASEHIQNLNSGLLALEKDPTNREVIDELFRAAHTLKGSAAMMGFQGISDVGHKSEDMLGLFRSGSIPITRETLNFLFDSVDAVKLMVDGIASKKPEDPLIVENITQSFTSLVDTLRGRTAPSPSRPAPGAAPAEKSTPAAAPPASPAPVSSSAAKAPEKPASLPSKEELDLAWEKAFAEEAGDSPRPDKTMPKTPVSASKKAAPSVPWKPATTVPSPVAPPQPASQRPSATQAAADTADPGAAAEASLQREIEEAKRAGVVEKRGTGRRAADAPDIEKQFIRVNIERLDNLMNLVGEMVVNRNKLTRQVDLIKSLRDELSFSQNRLLYEIRKFEEKYEYTMNFQTPAPAGPEQRPAGQSGDFF